jgi:hypothetical protein
MAALGDGLGTDVKSRPPEWTWQPAAVVLVAAWRAFHPFERLRLLGQETAYRPHALLQTAGAGLGIQMAFSRCP